MSSVGFFGKTGSDLEIEKLREAYDSLKDVMRGIASAQACIERMNFGMAKDHLTAALWSRRRSKKGNRNRRASAKPLKRF
jgi:DNA-binding FrmR family transcriptional regulator